MSFGVEYIQPGDMGWSIRKGLKKVGRGIKKGAVATGKGVAKGAKYTAKGAVYVGKKGYAVGTLVAKLALLPFYLMLKATKLIGRAIAAAPDSVLRAGVVAANVNPNFIPIFRAAAAKNFNVSFGTLKSILPPTLKVAAKMAATGAFPPAAPALRAVAMIPGVGQYLSGADLADGDEALGAYLAGEGDLAASTPRWPVAFNLGLWGVSIAGLYLALRERNV